LKIRRALASLGGVAGPAVFVAAWVVSGSRTVGYSPLAEPISRLAARRCACRPAMTAGFLAYSIGVAGFATRVDVLGGPAAIATAANAVAMAALAASPLSDTGSNRAHVAAAGAAYTSLTVAPLLAAHRHRQGAHRREAAASATAGVAAGGLLALSVIHHRGQGGWQRAGLIAGQAWIASSAACALLGGGCAAVTRSMPSG
jgi:hypothetical protein